MLRMKHGVHGFGSPAWDPGLSAAVNMCTAALRQDPDQTDGPRFQVSEVTGQIKGEARG